VKLCFEMATSAAALPPPERGRVGVGVTKTTDPHPTHFVRRPPPFRGRLRSPATHDSSQPTIRLCSAAAAATRCPNRDSLAMNPRHLGKEKAARPPSGGSTGRQERRPVRQPGMYSGTGSRLPVP